MKHSQRYMGLFIATAVITITLGVIAGLSLQGPYQSRQLNTEAFNKLEKGMPQEQVESLLGGPPGDYGINAGGQSIMTCEGYFAPPGCVQKIWFNDNTRFEICFNRQDRVVSFHERARFRRKPPPPLTQWERLLQYLGIQEESPFR